MKTSRIPLLALAMAALLLAMWAGLIRIGWKLPDIAPALPGGHGPLMVSGFLGTLICVERAVGLGYRWTYVAPVLAGLGGMVMALTGYLEQGALLMTAGSVGLAAIMFTIARLQPSLHAATMASAAVLWVSGNLLWVMGFGIPVAVAWWAAFLVLTIAGERLELTRLLFISRGSQALFVGIVGLLVVGLVVLAYDGILGWRIVGAALLALAAWLLRHDIARRTVRQEGLTRFIAVCMLSGYFWLGLAGALALWYGFLSGGVYDSVLHAIFLGFVFSMIFGHAPIIFPAVLGVEMEWKPGFYHHLILLHASLALRVVSGLTEWLPGRQWAIVLNVIAILVFLFHTVRSIRFGGVQRV